MDELVSSPSPYLPRLPSQTPFGETQLCVCVLADITAQILNEDEKLRFKCLAYARRGKSGTYYRCEDSSKNFRTKHPELFNRGKEILLGEDEKTPIERFCIVIRMFFCATHCKLPAFSQYSESIKSTWKGDGNDEEKELLKAIRQAYGLRYPANSAPAVLIQSSASHAAGVYSGSVAEVSATEPDDASSTQCPLPPMGIGRPGEHSQSVPNVGTVPESSMESRGRRRALSVQSRHVRSQSNPEASSNSHQEQLSADQLSHRSSQANMELQDPFSTFNNPISQSPAPSPSSSATSLGPAFLTQRPPKHLLTPTAPSKHMRRRSNPAQKLDSIEQSQDSKSHAERQPAMNYATPLKPSSPYFAPLKDSFDSFDSTPPGPQRQAANLNTAPVNQDNFNLSLPIQDFDSGATQRPVLNDHLQSASAPSVLQPSTPQAAAILPASHDPALETASQAAPTLTTSPELKISASPTSDTPEEFVDSGVWDEELYPKMTGENKLSPVAMPHRQRSKDDSCLEQLASAVAAATAPSHFQSNKQLDGSAPGPSAETEKIEQIFFPMMLDYMIRKKIRDPVSKEGHIYILKSPLYFQKHFPNQPPLLKIGMSNDVSKRMKSLKEKCGLFDLARVSDPQDIPLQLYWKVEELVHCELLNFRRVFKCKKCKNSKSTETEHQEWFAVDEEVALRVVQRWREFIAMEPYDENGQIKSHWSSTLTRTNPECPGAAEQWDDPLSRDRRWTKWLHGKPKVVENS